MVDTNRRKRLAFHLRQLIVGITTNDDFENAVTEEITVGWLPEQYHKSKIAKTDDSIILPIVEQCWTLYSDLENHKLEGKYKLSLEQEKVLARCILFLQTDIEYKWPYFNIKAQYSLLDYLIILLTLGLYHPSRKKQMLSYIEWQKHGDFEVWPFFSQNEYEAQLKNQPFLNGINAT